jgi:hypothetical protein
MKSVSFMALLALSFATCAFPAPVVTYDAPGVQTTNVAGASIYSFNSMATDRTVAAASAFAAFSRLYVIGANQFGGAIGSRYGVVGDPTGAARVVSSTLTFANPVSYVGFWWSAADPHNMFTLYNGNTAVLTMTNDTLLTALGSCGGLNSYCGNPNTGQDPSELFAYVNIWATNGSTFTSARFQQIDDLGGFEFDNLATAGDPPGDSPSIPEPATWAFCGVGLVVVSMLMKRARRA